MSRVEILFVGEDKASGPIKEIKGEIGELEKQVETADTKSKGLFSSLGGLGKLALGAGIAVGAAAVAGLGAALVGGIADAREAKVIMAQTENAIRATGGAAGVSAQHVSDFAASLSAANGKSLFGDSQYQESTNLLLTFKNIKGETLDLATALTGDLAQALGGDPQSQAMMLGKALDNPTKGMAALGKAGLTFTDAQKEQITAMQEAGDMAGAQAIIIAELNSQVGGSAEAAAKADGGMAQFKDRMGELAENVGAKVLPAMNGLMGFLNSDGVQAGITGLVDGLVSGVTSIGTAIGSVTTAFQDGGLTGVFDLVLPKLQAFGTSVLTWIAEQAPIWGAQLLTWGTAFGQWVIDALPPLMEKLGTLLQSLLTWVADNAPAWAAELLKFGLAAVEWVTAAMGPLVDKLGEFANKMINWVVDQLPGWGVKLAEFGALAIKWILDALPGLAVNLGTFAGKLIGWILQTAIDVVPKLALMAVKFVGWVLTDVLPELPGALAKIFDALVLFVQTAGVDIVPKLKVMAQMFLDWVQKDVIPFLSEKLNAILSGISNWVTGAATAVSGYVVSIGTALVDGIRSGVASAWSGFLGWIDAQIAKIPQAIRDFLGIASPSRVMAEQVGKWIPAGIADGIKNNMGLVQDALAGGAYGMGALNVSASGAASVAMGGSGGQTGPSHTTYIDARGASDPRGVEAAVARALRVAGISADLRLRTT